MSRMIANTISFSKDYSTAKFKGGDSNVSPRSNVWTNDIPIDEVFRLLDGGSVELSRSKKYTHIHAATARARENFKARFGKDGLPSYKTSIWAWPYMVAENRVTPEDIQFYDSLLKSIIEDIRKG